jgi:undecaprenyl-diphosphatase
MQFSVLSELILSVILGITQGITEFLPISSTAHLRLVTALLADGKDIGLAASNVIQFATLLAILVYFKKDLGMYYRRIVEVFQRPRALQEFRYNFQVWRLGGSEFLGSSQDQETDITLSQLIVGTLPIVILGYFLKNFAESTRDIREIAWFLIGGSVLMGFAEYVHRSASKQQDNRPQHMNVGEVVLIGLFQSLAAFPGISRSGATLSGALLLGRDRAKSVRFSFLLSIPALTLLGIIDLFNLIRDWIRNGVSLTPTASGWNGDQLNLSILSLAISFVLAYAFGIISLKWLLKYLSTHTFLNFIIYRVALALVIFVLVYASAAGLINFI